MKRRKQWTTLVALVVAAGVAACGGDTGEEEVGAETEQPAQTAQPETGQQGQQVALGPAPEGATQEMVQQGQQIFTGNGNCFTCHGMDATGTQLAPDQTDSEWINIEGEATWEAIQEVVRNGVPNPVEHPSPMPPMGGAQLTDEEIAAVSAYVYAISHQGGGAAGGS